MHQQPPSAPERARESKITVTNKQPRLIAYSTASMNALAEGVTIEEALAHAAPDAKGDLDFIVVAEVASTAPLRDLDSLPRQAVIVWRGANDLAQTFRNSKI